MGVFGMPKDNVQEGLGFVRFILVWSSLSPVFLLWAIRGVNAVEDQIWIPTCLSLFLIPNLILLLFYMKSKKSNNVKTVEINKTDDQGEHLLTYLFAMLIPLFEVNLGGIRDVIAVAFAFIFVMFLFWHMRLHYMNLIFAGLGYRIFTAEATVGDAGNSAKSRLASFVIISRRHRLPDGAITGYRLGGNVLVDNEDD